MSIALALASGCLRLTPRPADCDMGGMYKSPTAGEQLKAEDPFTISWDTTCMAPAGDSVNISLYNTNTTSSDAHIHTWAEVSWSAGSYSVRSLFPPHPHG